MIVGFLYSLLILLVFSPTLVVIDTFNLTCHYAPILIVSLHAGLGLFSFTLDTWSTSRGDTAQILGTGAGIAVASHLNYQLNLIPDPPASMLPFPPPTLSFSLVGLCLLRFVLGVLLILVTRAVMKALTVPLVCWFFGIPSGDIRKARQHMQVELPYRYIVYWTVGFSAFFLVPTFFFYIGLSWLGGRNVFQTGCLVRSESSLWLQEMSGASASLLALQRRKITPPPLRAHSFTLSLSEEFSIKPLLIVDCLDQSNGFQSIIYNSM